MYDKISDYGIIGDSRTVALVSRTGSIDWLCLPDIDSPSVFASILDDSKGGRFAVRPFGTYDFGSRYIEGTNILQTFFEASSGRVVLTDFMLMPTDRGRDLTGGSLVLYRKIEAESGEHEIEIIFDPRFDYARADADISVAEDVLIASGGGSTIRLDIAGAGTSVLSDSVRSTFTLREGDAVWLRLSTGGGGSARLSPVEGEAALDETIRYWREWLAKNETGRDLDTGAFKSLVDRSALTLKLLEYGPTGALAAAATTSLPEAIGGVRNWDYRYSWVRDSSLTIEALYGTGHLSEMENYLRWMRGVMCDYGGFQVMYGLRGERELTEQTLDHLEGYRGSKPVRIGNGAWDQDQLDIYGEILDAAFRLSNYAGKIDLDMWEFLRRSCDTVVERWRDKDSGIWEVRDGPWHFVYSKIMCWVALDRGLKIARRYGFPAELGKWERERDLIRAEVLERGWNADKNAFVQHYDTDALDASCLLIPFYGFLPYDDSWMVSTAEAIQRELTEDGFVYRYRAQDGLPGEEGTFLICTYWLIENLIGQGRLDEARKLLVKMERTANELGLFAEEYDAATGEALGNFPQAFTHIGYINSVLALSRAEKDRKRRGTETASCSGKVKAFFNRRILFTRRFILNSGEDVPSGAVADVAGDLKRLMNTLRGGFFHPAEGRVAYEEIAGSSFFRLYKACSSELSGFDLSSLRSPEERLAFWINIFNVLVIHGVIELGIRDSIKEVTNFFRRIGYNIGGMTFTADDIEHGILRGNARLPVTRQRPFRGNDPRLSLMTEHVDPRIHFALVCASRSCPPIEIYRAETLEKDLEISGRTFINSGGAIIDRGRGSMILSEIFRWYRDDFGGSNEAVLDFIAPYFYEEADRRFVEKNAGRLKISYEPYDWRLNRT